MDGLGGSAGRRRRVLETRPQPREATTFSRWIEKKNIPVAEVALRIGVSPKTVYYWAAGFRVPDLVSAFRVEEVTQGEVPAMSFLMTRTARRIHGDLIEHSRAGTYEETTWE